MLRLEKDQSLESVETLAINAIEKKDAKEMSDAIHALRLLGKNYDDEDGRQQIATKDFLYVIIENAIKLDLDISDAAIQWQNYTETQDFNIEAGFLYIFKKIIPLMQDHSLMKGFHELMEETAECFKLEKNLLMKGYLASIEKLIDASIKNKDIESLKKAFLWINDLPSYPGYKDFENQFISKHAHCVILFCTIMLELNEVLSTWKHETVFTIESSFKHMFQNFYPKLQYENISRITQCNKALKEAMVFFPIEKKLEEKEISDINKKLVIYEKLIEKMKVNHLQKPGEEQKDVVGVDDFLGMDKEAILSFKQRKKIEIEEADQSCITPKLSNNLQLFLLSEIFFQLKKTNDIGIQKNIVRDFTSGKIFTPVRYGALSAEEYISRILIQCLLLRSTSEMSNIVDGMLNDLNSIKEKTAAFKKLKTNIVKHLYAFVSNYNLMQIKDDLWSGKEDASFKNHLIIMINDIKEKIVYFSNYYGETIADCYHAVGTAYCYLMKSDEDEKHYKKIIFDNYKKSKTCFSDGINTGQILYQFDIRIDEMQPELNAIRSNILSTALTYLENPQPHEMFNWICEFSTQLMPYIDTNAGFIKKENFVFSDKGLEESLIGLINGTVELLAQKEMFVTAITYCLSMQPLAAILKANIKTDLPEICDSFIFCLVHNKIKMYHALVKSFNDFSLAVSTSKRMELGLEYKKTLLKFKDNLIDNQLETLESVNEKLLDVFVFLIDAYNYKGEKEIVMAYIEEALKKFPDNEVLLTKQKEIENSPKQLQAVQEPPLLFSDKRRSLIEASRPTLLLNSSPVVATVNSKEERRRLEEEQKAKKLAEKKALRDKKIEQARKNAEARTALRNAKIEEAKKAEEVRKIEEAAKNAEEVRRIEEAKKEAETKKIEEARKEEETRKIIEEKRKAKIEEQRLKNMEIERQKEIIRQEKAREKKEAKKKNQENIKKAAINRAIEQAQEKRKAEELAKKNNIVEKRAEEKQVEKKQEIERKEETKKELERQEAERQEAERPAAELEAGEKFERERREKEKLIAEKMEDERRNAEKNEAAKNLEIERQEAERKKAEKQDTERQETELQAAEKLETERREKEKLIAEKMEDERRNAEKEEAAKNLEIERAIEEIEVEEKSEKIDIAKRLNGEGKNIPIELLDFLYKINQELAPLQAEVVLYGSVIIRLGIEDADKASRVSVDDIDVKIICKPNVNIDLVAQVLMQNNFIHSPKESHVNVFLKWTLDFNGMNIDITQITSDSYRSDEFILIRMGNGKFIEIKDETEHAECLAQGRLIVKLPNYCIEIIPPAKYKDAYIQTLQSCTLDILPLQNQFKDMLYTVSKYYEKLKCLGNVEKKPAFPEFISYHQFLEEAGEYFDRRLKEQSIVCYWELNEFIKRDVPPEMEKSAANAVSTFYFSFIKNHPQMNDWLEEKQKKGSLEFNNALNLIKSMAKLCGKEFIAGRAWSPKMPLITDELKSYINNIAYSKFLNNLLYLSAAAKFNLRYPSQYVYTQNNAGYNMTVWRQKISNGNNIRLPNNHGHQNGSQNSKKRKK